MSLIGDSNNKKCLGFIRDCVGKVGDCPVVISVEECGDFVRENRQEFIKDCVGKVGDCPIVISVEECGNFVRENGQQVKDWEDVSDQFEIEEIEDVDVLDDVEKLIPAKKQVMCETDPSRPCTCGKNPDLAAKKSLKERIDNIITQLVEIHNSL